MPLIKYRSQYQYIERNNNLKPHSPFILSGTNCIEGNGMGIVIAVGEHSQKGIIKRIVDNAQEDNKTPLEQKLDIIAEMIGWFGMGAAVVTLVALSLRFVIQYIKDEEERRLGDTFWDNILVENFNTSVASSPYWKTFLIAQIKLGNRAFLSKDIDVFTSQEHFALFLILS